MSAISTTRREIVTGAAVTLLAAGPALSAGRKGKFAPVKGGKEAEALGKALLAETKAPALSIAVARTSGALWSAAFGQSDLEMGVAATPAHSFRMGSVSKVVTSTLAARLVSRGLLDLDTPISRWMPDLPAHHRETSMKQLLTHRGGVRHYIQRDYDITGPGGAIYRRLYRTDQDVLDLFINDPLVAPPGSRVSYSSYGFTLASMVMAKAAGRDFVEMVRSEIGRPLGLSSLVADDVAAIVPARATGYMQEIDRNMLYGQLPAEARPALTNGLANIPQSNPAYCWAGAGFLMTTPDCARFGAAMLDSPDGWLTPAERSLLFTQLTEGDKSNPPLGLAWRIDKDSKGRLRWHHAGSTPGGRYSLVVYPAEGLSVALASNVMTAPGNVLKPSSDLVDLFSA